MRAYSTIRVTRGLVVACSAVALLTLASCGDDATTSTSPSTSASPTPDGSNASLVAQVSIGGGYVTAEHALSTVPRLTVLADGTVITAGVVPAMYPGPAIMPLRETKVAPADVRSLIDQARDAGLLERPIDFGQPPIADAPTTVVTIVADGVTHQHRAEALSESATTGPTGTGISGTGSLSDAAVAHRRALQSFIDAADGLTGAAGSDGEWLPSTIAVTVTGPYQSDPSGPVVAPVDWPLSWKPALPTTSGEMPCTLVRGADAAVLLDALHGANQRTPWIIDGAARGVVFRAVVPGDPGCPN
jgi:hypothetical protein